MAKDFAPETKTKNKTKYLKGPTVSQIDTKSSNFYRISIYLCILCGLVTCLLLLYIQNGMHDKFNFTNFSKQTLIKPKCEFYKILSRFKFSQTQRPTLAK